MTFTRDGKEDALDASSVTIIRSFLCFMISQEDRPTTEKTTAARPQNVSNA